MLDEQINIISILLHVVSCSISTLKIAQEGCLNDIFVKLFLTFLYYRLKWFLIFDNKMSVFAYIKKMHIYLIMSFFI